MKPRRPRPRQVGEAQGSAYLIALVSLVVCLLLAVALLRASSATAQGASRLDRKAAARCLAEGGVDYGLWLYRYSGARLPIHTRRAVGNGVIDVIVEDNSRRARETIRIQCTAEVNGSTYTALLTAPVSRPPPETASNQKGSTPHTASGEGVSP